ncbi:hypothetical protein HK102_004705 [Quaeritorhiza haematococci]|nr:hypothetical protein HK102_004705 [Quaeritorhiza haematococci]
MPSKSKQTTRTSYSSIVDEENNVVVVGRRGSGSSGGALSDSELMERKTKQQHKANLRSYWTYEYHDDVDPSIEFFYRPRTITFLILMFLALIYVALFVVEDDRVFNTKVGIFTSIGVLLLLGMLEFRDGPFIRPHPAFWRVVLAASVAYQMILVFVLFQTKGDMRAFLRYIDPSLGVPLPERSYAESCDITWNTLYDQMDVFVIAHSLGWYAKAIVLRDYWFCWILSVMFELMEYSLQHQLPNFAECWWDHWILDVLTTNWLGTYLGMKTCEYLAMKQYDWRSIREIPTYRGKVKRALKQFTPHSWTTFKWGATRTFKSFVAVLGLLYLELQCELNAFYLKYLLWIPPSHYLNVWRLILYFFMCIPAVREAYQYLTDPQCKKFGMHAWMVTANILTELLICVKFGKGEFPAPMPKEVVIFWTSMAAALAGWVWYKFWKGDWVGWSGAGAVTVKASVAVGSVVNQKDEGKASSKSLKDAGNRNGVSSDSDDQPAWKLEANKESEPRRSERNRNKKASGTETTADESTPVRRSSKRVAAGKAEQIASDGDRPTMDGGEQPWSSPRRRRGTRMSDK